MTLYDEDDIVAVLRSPGGPCQVADLIDNSRALLDATAKTAHVSVQTEMATATVGTTMTALSTCVTWAPWPYFHQ